MNHVTLIVALLALSPCLVVSQTATTRKPAQSTAAGAQRAAEAKLKAIFEPVNYKQDLTLFDVFFVSKDVGRGFPEGTWLRLGFPSVGIEAPD